MLINGFTLQTLPDLSNSNYAISGFRRDVNEIYALLGYYAAHTGNSVPTFRDNISISFLRVKNSKILEDGPAR